LFLPLFFVLAFKTQGHSTIPARNSNDIPIPNNIKLQHILLAWSWTDKVKLIEGILDELGSVEINDKHITDKVAMVSSLCDPRIGEREKSAYALEDVGRIRFAVDSLKGPDYGCFLGFAELPECWGEIEWSSFSKGAQKILELGLLRSVKNPVALSVLEVMSSLTASCGKQVWFDALLQHLAAARCSMPQWVDSKSPVKPDDFTPQHLSVVVKSCSKLLGASDVVWLADLKKACQEQKVAKEAAAKKTSKESDQGEDQSKESGVESGQGADGSGNGEAKIVAERAVEPPSCPAEGQGDSKETAKPATPKVDDIVSLHFRKSGGKNFQYHGLSALVEEVLTNDVKARLIDPPYAGEIVKIPIKQTKVIGEKLPDSAPLAEKAKKAEDAPSSWERAQDIFGASALEDEDD
jgi:hypothetical protein